MNNRIWLFLVCLAAAALVLACVTTSQGHIDWDFINQSVKQEANPALAAAGIFSGGLSLFGSAFNYWQQKKNQQEIWNREDTAVQRRAADLEAAGLSKTLAAGSAATTNVTSAPELQGGQVQDALNAAASLQGIKNAKQENANMKTAQLKDMAEIALYSRQGQKMDAESNYFSAMANKAMIDGELSGYLGLKALQDIAESKERAKGYKHSAALDDSHSQLNFFNALRAAQELDLVNRTGHNSSVGGTIPALLKGGKTMMENLWSIFSGYNAPPKVLNFNMDNFKY